MAIEVKAGWIVWGASSIVGLTLMATTVDMADWQWFFTPVNESHTSNVGRTDTVAVREQSPVESTSIAAETQPPEEPDSPENLPATTAPPEPTALPEPEKAEQTAAPESWAEVIRKDRPASPDERVFAKYPPRALQRRVEGTVALEGEVGADGAVGSVRVLSGDELLIDAAVEAFKQWKYYPAQRDGIYVPSTVRANFTFRLK